MSAKNFVKEIAEVLKEKAFLERMKCKFIDSKDVMGLNNTTNSIGDGAIIYIDDFIGSGTQLCKSRDFAFKHVIGNFSEFLVSITQILFNQLKSKEKDVKYGR